MVNGWFTGSIYVATFVGVVQTVIPRVPRLPVREIGECVPGRSAVSAKVLDRWTGLHDA